MRFFTAYVFLLSCLFISCKAGNNDTHTQKESEEKYEPLADSLISRLKQENYVSFGTSYGMCTDYCYTEYIYTDKRLYEMEKAPFGAPKYPDIIDSTYLEDSTFQKIFLNLNLFALVKLDSVIGCPDCTDGGACWFEFKLGKLNNEPFQKKITYDCQDAPEAVLRAIEIVKNQ